MTIAIAAAVAVGGTVAYFSDTETSTGNTFTAGTLDLGLGNSSGTATTGSVTQTWKTGTAWAPGNTEDKTLYVKNSGTINATKIKVAFTETLTNGTPTTVDDPKATALDEKTIATTVKWNGVVVSALQGKSIKELSTSYGVSTPYDLGAVQGLDANTEKGLQILWTFDTTADNGCQGDAVDATITVTLEQ